MCTTALHFMQERDQNATARRANRMTEGDRAAIHIDAFAVPAQFVADGQRLDGKSFVSFNQIKVVDIPACAFQGRARCRNRAKPH